MKRIWLRRLTGKEVDSNMARKSGEYAIWKPKEESISRKRNDQLYGILANKSG